VADNDTEIEATEPGHDGSQEERLTSVEGKLDALIETVNKLVPGSHAEAQDRTERRLERPQRAEDATRATVREELARAKEDEERQQREAGEKETLNSRLAKLEERPPAEYRSKLKRVVTHGWGS
jgi:hypothetical protein